MKTEEIDKSWAELYQTTYGSFSELFPLKTEAELKQATDEFLNGYKRLIEAPLGYPRQVVRKNLCREWGLRDKC